MVKVGRRFFFNQTFQKKQRRITIITIVCVITAIIVTFSVTNKFYDNSGEKGQIKYKVKEQYDVELFNVMPSFLNYFETIENVPLNSIQIQYPEGFTYDENGDNCTDEQLTIIKNIRNGQDKAENYDDPFGCLAFVPNKVGSYTVVITVGGEKNSLRLNVVDSLPPTFEAQNVTITNEETYNASTFITSCYDNSKTDCIFDFYHPLRGEIVDYSRYTEPGTYEIKVVAKDKSGNTAEPKTVSLTIKGVNYYTVSFNSNGGSAVESQTVREGSKAYSSYPSRDGYTFEGWYNGNSKYNFDQPVSSNLNLTAKWKKINTGGGGGTTGGGGGGGTTGGGGGGGSGKCQYGKYSDYSGSISMSASLIMGKSMSDCIEKSNSQDFNTLRQYAVDIATDLTSGDGAIKKDFEKIAGSSVDIHYQRNYEQINNGGGLVGIMVTIDATSSNGYHETYTLYNCSLTSCKWH